MIRLLSIADVITLSNAIFGFLAILMVFLDEVRLSFSFILIALLADGLDGVIARKTRKGELGEYLEAMADMTSMGIATSIFIYVTYHDYLTCCVYRQIYMLIALVLFLSFETIRLASYYIMKNKNYFVGLPASAGTIILLLLAFFKIEFIYILPAVIIIGAAMASDIKFPKPRIKMNAIAAVLILLTLVMYESYYGIAPLLLLIAILVYAIGGPIYAKFLANR
jgi:CDP-diacylglycerol--serine O-phosphatidyltransferase